MDSPQIRFVVVVQRHSPRRRQSMAGELYALASSFVIVGLICYGVYLGIATGKSATAATQVPKATVVMRSTQTARPVKHRGAGKNQSPIRQVSHVVLATGSRRNGITASAERRGGGGVARADALVLESLQAARQGMFTKANDLAQEARRICPTHPAATGAWYVAAYAAQYPDLADEALSRLNGTNDDIDLGSRYGRSAFVERTGDTYTFRCKGGNKTFTAATLNSMDGVRFRIARQFLDDGGMPANDLILAAVHHLKNLDAAGNYSQYNRERSLVAAQARCRRAVGRDADVSKHARHLLALFDWLQARADSDAGGHGPLDELPTLQSRTVAVR